MTSLAAEAGALVRRSYAGDQNASALLERIGQFARDGRSPRAREAGAHVEQYIAQNPYRPFSLTLGKPKVTEVRTQRAPSIPPEQKVRQLMAGDPTELKKKPMPANSLARIRDPNAMIGVIAKSCGYRHGLQACSLVLANSQVISAAWVQQIADSCFGSEIMTSTFLYGVRNPWPEDWREISPHLDPNGRVALTVGQCIGRAMRLQALRGLDCPVSVFHEVVGWELGE